MAAKSPVHPAAALPPPPRGTQVNSGSGGGSGAAPREPPIMQVGTGDTSSLSQVTSATAGLSPASRTQLERLKAERAAAAEILDAEDNAMAMEVILEQNGWTREDFLSRNGELRTFELFLVDFAPSVPQLQYFPHLTTVRLMHAQLTEMRYFDRLRCLEELFLSENSITKIENLENCTQLRVLHLSMNHIAKIENLSTLRKLEVLGLVRNEISVVENLEALGELRTLWLSCNKIESLTGCFSGNAKLENLNLAGNHIGSFREIPPLNELPALTTLALSDPVYGDNPVCSLSNYTTFTLFHVQRITTLDHVAVSADQRCVAEATFVKKKIYYNMRIRTLKRNLAVVARCARAFAAAKGAERYHSLDMLWSAEAVIDKRLAEARWYKNCGGGGDATTGAATVPVTTAGAVADLEVEEEHTLHSFAAKQAALQKLIALQLRELAAIDARLFLAEAHMCRAVDVQISRLLIELHTGGNVRLEEGRAKEIWHQSCVELVRTRFHATDFEGLGLKDVRVHKVTRIHNRTLRLQFDRTLESLVDLSDPSYKRALEYLFFAGDVGWGDEALHTLMERGFPLADSAPSPNRDCCSSGPRAPASHGVPVTNSLFLADQQRLAAARHQGELPLDTDASAMPAEVLVGRIVVAKVFLGRCSPEKAAVSGASAPSPSGSPLHELTANVLSTAPPTILQSDYPPTTASVFRAKNRDPKQRVWFCFEPSLVLPEYLIDFSYVPATATTPKPALAELGHLRPEELSSELRASLSQSAASGISAADEVDCRIFAPHFLHFSQWCRGRTAAAENGARDVAAAIAAKPNIAAEPPLLLPPPPPPPAGTADAPGGGSGGGDDEGSGSSSSGAKGVGNALLEARHLTLELIDSYTSVWGFRASTDPGRLVYLNLMHQQLVSAGPNLLAPGGTAPFSGLTQLNLAHNALTRIDPALEHALPQLTHLVLSHNDIKRLQHLRFKHLEVLRLESNLIFRWADVASLRTCGRGCLRELWLLDNPVMAERRLEELIVFEHPQLQVVNGKPSGPMRAQLGPRPREMTLRLLAAVASVQMETGGLSGRHSSRWAAGVHPTAMSARDCLWEGVCTHTTLAPPHRYGPPLAPALPDPGLDDADLDAAPLHSPARVSLTSEAAAAAVTAVGEAGGEDEEGEEVVAILKRATVVSLVALRIDSIRFVHRLPALAHLQLASNFITRIEGLHSCACLETLDLRDNRITTMEGLGSLTNLRKLDLGENCIDKIEGLESLTKLSLLALDNNQITSVTPVAAAAGSLVELYLSCNLISNEKELNALRDMGKLIIMDLAHNPCTHAELYRSYAIFQLKKLKVLDGVAVDPPEAQRARDTFAGRVSAELLGERLPPGTTDHSRATELNLASCALKELTLLDDFTSLRHLKLDHNLLQSINGIQRCTSLVTLNISFNKLGDAAVGAACEAMVSLESISLEANQITSIGKLQLNFPQLKFLNLRGNEIMRVDGLDRLPQLREILLDKNRLRALERDCFAHTPMLRELYCEENAIKLLEGVKTLQKLSKLSLASNRLNEIVDVEKAVEGLPIVDLCLLGNPIVRKPLYRNTMIHALPVLAVLDNKAVSAEERERAEAIFAQEAIPPNVFTDVRSPVTGGGPIAIAVPQPPSKAAMRVMTLEAMAASAQDGGGGGGGGGGVGGYTFQHQHQQQQYASRSAGAGLRGAAVGGGLGAGNARVAGAPPARTSSADLRTAKPRSTSTGYNRRPRQK